MIVINLFAEPSAGKTTTMFALAAKMKRMGLSVDIASEFYKELVYEHTPINNNDIGKIAESTQQHVQKFGGQLSVLAEQNKRLARLAGTVDFAITDCPIPLIAYYTPKDYVDGFEQLALIYSILMKILTFLLKEIMSMKRKARVHSEEDSHRIASELPLYLEKHIGKNYKTLSTSNSIEDKIIQALVKDELLNDTAIKNKFKM